MALCLEQYLDNLQTLPGEVQRNLRLIRELDEKVTDAMTKVDDLAGQWVKDEDKSSGEEKRKRKEEIQSLMAKSKSWSEEKWQISMQLYEMVDKHIRRLDGELARFEKELKRKVVTAKMDFEGAQSSTEANTAADRKGDKSAGQADKSKTQKGRKGQVVIDDSSASENAPPSKKKKKTAGESLTTGTHGPGTPVAGTSGTGRVQPLSPGSLGVEQLASLTGAALIQQLVGVGGHVLDMPIDPNEPVYCTCRQVSYGEMIGCDNSDCQIEWFHFGCVGITSKPKGKWYCQMCKDSIKKKGSPAR